MQVKSKAQSSNDCVLVVDDSPEIAESLGRLLRRKQCEVHIAHSGLQALNIAEEVQPDIVLLDIGLPDISGLEVARVLRSAKKNQKPLRLIALSGWGAAKHKKEAKLAGFDCHLTKPISAAELLAVLKLGCRNPV